MSVSSTIQRVLIKTSDILGADVHDAGGHKLATIRELFIDPLSGQAHFAIVEAGGLFGAGGKYHPIPWSMLRWDAGRNGYIAPFGKDRLKDAPSYDRDQINSNAYGWDATVQRYYGEAPAAV